MDTLTGNGRDPGEGGEINKGKSKPDDGNSDGPGGRGEVRGGGGVCVSSIKIATTTKLPERGTGDQLRGATPQSRENQTEEGTKARWCQGEDW